MISIVLSILYLTLGNWYFHLYFVEEDIIAMGARIMQVMTVIVLLQISQVIYMGCLRGAGDVVFTTCASTLSITIVRPSCAYLFCYVLEIGVVGIWLGIVCDQIVRVCLRSRQTSAKRVFASERFDSMSQHPQKTKRAVCSENWSFQFRSHTALFYATGNSGEFPVT